MKKENRRGVASAIGGTLAHVWSQVQNLFAPALMRAQAQAQRARSPRFTCRQEKRRNRRKYRRSFFQTHFRTRL